MGTRHFKIIDVRYYNGDIHVLDANNKLIPISYLSDGFQDIIGIVSDIAYRMAILNPHLEEKILSDTPGIVLIDEIELHLHPKWQQNILNILKKVFTLQKCNRKTWRATKSIQKTVLSIKREIV